jgi:hypothetical protein
MDDSQFAGAIYDAQFRKAGDAEALCGWSPGVFIGSNTKGIDGWVEHQISLGEVGLRFAGRFPVIPRIEGEDQDVWIVTVFRCAQQFITGRTGAGTIRIGPRKRACGERIR